MGRYNLWLVKTVFVALGIVIIFGLITMTSHNKFRHSVNYNGNDYYYFEGTAPEIDDMEYVGKINDYECNSDISLSKEDLVSNAEEEGNEVFRYNNEYLAVKSDEGVKLYHHSDNSSDGLVPPIIKIDDTFYIRTESSPTLEKSATYIGEVSKSYANLEFTIGKHDPNFTSNCEPKGSKVYRSSNDGIIVESGSGYDFFEELTNK